VQSRPLATPSFYPVAEAPQILQGNPAAEPLRLGHNPLGDSVVDIPLVSPLPSGEFSEFAPRRPRAQLLQSLATMGIDLSLFFDCLTAIGLLLTVGEEVGRPQITAHIVVHSSWSRNIDLDNLVED
jgi:hypothetical protein